MRLLVVKLSSFGDVIHTFPAITDLKAARPDIEVDWLVEESLAPFVALHPGIAESPHARLPPAAEAAVALAAPRRRDVASPARPPRPQLRPCRRPPGADEERACRRGSPGRSAATTPTAPASRRPRASTAGASPCRAQMHAVERTRRLLAAAVGYPVPDGPGRYGIAVSGRPDPALGLPARYAMVMHAASWPTKLWPEEHWQRAPARRSRPAAGASCFPGAALTRRRGRSASPPASPAPSSCRG